MSDNYSSKLERVYSLKLNEKLARGYEALDRKRREDLADELRERFAEFLHAARFNPKDWK